MAEAYLNYLTARNGAVLVDVSSEYRDNHAHHVLTDQESVPPTQELWLSTETLPQTLLFDLSGLKERPATLKCFGWLCWKAYSSNPALVDIAASEDGKVYEKLGTLQGQQTSGPQFFPIKPVLPRFAYLQIVIRQTFGANKTYLNQVFLLEEIPGEKQLPDSQDLKTLLRKQLNHLEENVRNMQADQVFPLQSSLPRPRSAAVDKPTSFFLPEETPVKQGGELAVLHDTLMELTEQVRTLQEQVTGQRNIEVLKEFKQQLMTELMQREERMDYSPVGLPRTQQDFLQQWQEKVLEPRLAQFEAHILSLLRKPKVEDIMLQIEEKVRVRNQKMAQLEIQQKAADSRYRDSYSSLY